jgi:MFS family permease
VFFSADVHAVVRERDFRRLFATRLTSQASDGVFQVGLASYVFFSPERQTSATAAAAAFATLLLPYSLFGPFAGVLLDRWRRRQILMVCNLVRSLMVVGVAALVTAGEDGPLFFASALAVLSVNRFFLSGLSAALPHVVHPEDLVMANSVSTTSGTLVAIVGGGVGYLLSALVGGGDVTVLLLAAAGYATSSLFAGRMAVDLLGPDFDPDRPQAREAVRHVARGMLEGARHVSTHRQAALALSAIAAHRFFYGISTIATILLYRNYFNDPADVDAGLRGLAMVFVVSGVGFFTAALLTPEVTHRMSKATWITWLFAVAAVVEIVLGLPYTEPALLGAAFVLGVVAQGSKICVDTLVQESVDDAYRGRVFSFYDVLFNVSFVAAAAFAAVALPPTGQSYPVLVVIAVGYAATALAYGRLSRRQRLAVPA